jgi:hypothetical protein
MSNTRHREAGPMAMEANMDDLNDTSDTNDSEHLKEIRELLRFLLAPRSLEEEASELQGRGMGSRRKPGRGSSGSAATSFAGGR